MKTYRALAYKELLASKITSVLILIAVILSTMMTTAIGQSLGILSAMRDQPGHCAEWEPICDVCSDGSGAGG